jgi:hypothetical protein
MRMLVELTLLALILLVVFLGIASIAQAFMGQEPVVFEFLRELGGFISGL